MCTGSGKSALVEHLAAVTGNSNHVHVHVDDQMDAKSMLGAYVCTAVPGEFSWQPGPLTQVLFCLYCLVVPDRCHPVDVILFKMPLANS